MGHIRNEGRTSRSNWNSKSSRPTKRNWGSNSGRSGGGNSASTDASAKSCGKSTSNKSLINNSAALGSKGTDRHRLDLGTTAQPRDGQAGPRIGR